MHKINNKLTALIVLLNIMNSNAQHLPLPPRITVFDFSPPVSPIVSPDPSIFSLSAAGINLDPMPPISPNPASGSDSGSGSAPGSNSGSGSNSRSSPVLVPINEPLCALCNEPANTRLSFKLIKQPNCEHYIHGNCIASPARTGRYRCPACPRAPVSEISSPLRPVFEKKEYERKHIITTIAAILIISRFIVCRIKKQEDEKDKNNVEHKNRSLHSFNSGK